MADFLAPVTLATFQAGASSDTGVVGAEPVLEAISAANDATYARDLTNTTHTGVAAFTLGTLPADFRFMATLSIRLRVGLSAAQGNNTWTAVRARIWNTTLTTPLTDEVTVASNIANSTPANTTVVAFTGVSTTATKPTWVNSRVLLHFAITRAGGGDAVEERVYAAEFTGTYTPVEQPADLVTAVTYWTNPGISTVTGPWADMSPENVLWVDVTYKGWHRRLQGADNYWVNVVTLRYGMFNDPANNTWYDTVEAGAWTWQAGDNGETDVGGQPTSGERIVRGVYISNSEAISLGIIATPDAAKP